MSSNRFEDDDFEFQDEPDEAEEQDGEDVWRAVELDIMERQQKLELLDKAIGVARSYWLWNFLSSAKRLKAIDRAYNSLESLLQE